MPDDLYIRDILGWSEGQADLLRRLACGERVNDAVDWANVIEEVSDVGRSELHACESLIEKAGALAEVRGFPDGPVDHWRAETVAFLSGARRRFTP